MLFFVEMFSLMFTNRLSRYSLFLDAYFLGEFFGSFVAWKQLGVKLEFERKVSHFATGVTEQDFLGLFFWLLCPG